MDSNGHLVAPWNWIVPCVLLVLWFFIFFILVPWGAYKDRVRGYIKDLGKYCMFAKGFIDIFEIIYMYDLSVGELLIGYDRIIKVLNKHNCKYRPDRFYSTVDILPALDGLYSDDKIIRYFQKRAVARYLAKAQKKDGEQV